MLKEIFSTVKYINNAKSAALCNKINTHFEPDGDTDDILIIGVGDNHLTFLNHTRKRLGELYYENSEIKITDAGNLVQGATFADTKTALLEIITHAETKKCRILFLVENEHLGMQLFDLLDNGSEATVVGNLTGCAEEKAEQKIQQPRKQKYMNLLCYQAYLNNPELLEMNAHLGGENIRLGLWREITTRAEATFRRSKVSLFHYNAIPGSISGLSSCPSPNGLNATEACLVAYYMGTAGNSKWNIVLPVSDNTDTELNAQLIWHFIDGSRFARNENPPVTPGDFLKFYVDSEKANHHFVFYQSRYTLRWWIQIDHPHKDTENTQPTIIPCTEDDYKKAIAGELPDAWWLVNRRG